jgi:hypothetical protein
VESASIRLTQDCESRHLSPTISTIYARIALEKMIERHVFSLILPFKLSKAISKIRRFQDLHAISLRRPPRLFFQLYADFLESKDFFHYVIIISVLQFKRKFSSTASHRVFYNRYASVKEKGIGDIIDKTIHIRRVRVCAHIYIR